MEVEIDAERFFRRVLRLRSHWMTNKNNPNYYGNSDALCIPMGSVEDQEAMTYSKSAAIHLYFLGFEFPESLMVLTRDVFFFMATPKKCSYLEDAIKKHKSDELKIQILHKSKDAMQNSVNFGTIISNIKTFGYNIGTLLKGDFKGNFIASWTTFVENSNFNRVEISSALGQLLCVKDETELVIYKTILTIFFLN